VHARRPPSVKSARRAMEVMELFEKLRRPLGVLEIARLLEYPQSSASLLVNALAEMGYLNFDSRTRKFAPTLRLALLGSWIQGRGADPARLIALLRETSLATRETAVLSTQNALNVQYVYLVEHVPRGRLIARPGALRPLCRSAPGLVLLSRYPDPRIALIVRQLGDSGAGREDLADVMTRVRAMRETGYAWIAGRFDPAIGSVAVPLPFGDVFDKPLVLSIAAAAGRVRSQHARLGEQLLGIVSRASAAPGSP